MQHGGVRAVWFPKPVPTSSPSPPFHPFHIQGVRGTENTQCGAVPLLALLSVPGLISKGWGWEEGEEGEEEEEEEEEEDGGGCHSRC